MSRLKRVEYEVGEDVYGRTVSLIKEPQSNGQMSWTIHVEAASQRDENQNVSGLTDDVIREMAKVVSQK